MVGRYTPASGEATDSSRPTCGAVPATHRRPYVSFLTGVANRLRSRWKRTADEAVSPNAHSAQFDDSVTLAGGVSGPVSEALPRRVSKPLIQRQIG